MSELAALTDARRQLESAQRTASDAVELLARTVGRGDRVTLRAIIARTGLGDALTALDERVGKLREGMDR